ncbi:unnamed protein product [Ectocarpus sp. 8 AP-2014]
MIFFKHIWFLSHHLAGSSHCCCTKGAHAYQLHASSIAAPVSAERTDWQCERWPCSPRRVCVCVRRFNSSAITNHAMMLLATYLCGDIFPHPHSKERRSGRQ